VRDVITSVLTKYKCYGPQSRYAVETSVVYSRFQVAATGGELRVSHTHSTARAADQFGFLCIM